jgi:MYXO-CTERM domain-containing protein
MSLRVALIVCLAVIAYSPPSLGQSCAGNCGKFTSEAQCQCDAGCFGFNDCCTDICQVCTVEFEKECNCKPDCAGKQCGNDGCQGKCGECAEGQVCAVSKCIVSDCPEAGKVKDCNGTCFPAGWIADGTCDNGETTESDFYCEAFGFDGDDCKPCEPDCQGKICGWDGCGGSCGECPEGQVCQEGQCGVCTPECGESKCGADGCGGKCGTCAQGQLCDEGQCVEATGDCVGLCGQKSAGNCFCDTYCFTSGDCCADICTTCAAELEEECKEQACTPVCTGKQCGDDGCGGSCGTCEAGKSCTNGQCGAAQCQPACTGKQCGDDGCGGSCGTCGAGQICLQGQCSGGDADAVSETPEEEVEAPPTDDKPATQPKSNGSSSCSSAPVATPAAGAFLLLALLGLGLLRTRTR